VPSYVYVIVVVAVVIIAALLVVILLLLKRHSGSGMCIYYFELVTFATHSIVALRSSVVVRNIFDSVVHPIVCCFG